MEITALRGIERVAHLPAMRLTPLAFKSLPEYSASVPTGVKHLKTWRRLDGSHAINCPPQSRAWMIGRYEVTKELGDGRVEYQQKWFRPVIVLRAEAVRIDE